LEGSCGSERDKGSVAGFLKKRSHIVKIFKELRVVGGQASKGAHTTRRN